MTGHKPELGCIVHGTQSCRAELIPDREALSVSVRRGARPCVSITQFLQLCRSIQPKRSQGCEFLRPGVSLQGACSYRHLYSLVLVTPGAFSVSHACGPSHLLYVYPQHQTSPVMWPQLLAGHLQPRTRHTPKVQHLATCTQHRGAQSTHGVALAHMGAINLHAAHTANNKHRSYANHMMALSELRC